MTGGWPGQRYTLRTTPSVRRALTHGLPEPVAVAAYEFITGPLLQQPYRVGKQLLPPLDDRLQPDEVRPVELDAIRDRPGADREARLILLGPHGVDERGHVGGRGGEHDVEVRSDPEILRRHHDGGAAHRRLAARREHGNHRDDP